MSAEETCRRCGAIVRPESEGDLCPACLMEIGLGKLLVPGTRLGPYEIQAPIGAGGMGEVYRARDERLKRDVAIKVLTASFSDDPDRLARFEKEAQAASALNHPNIMSVHDVGSQDGTPYIVTELLDGQTLRERLAGGRLSPRKTVDYAAQIARGLAAAHAKGIVHRDLKPENVFVTRGEHVKILDFGVASWRPDANDPAAKISATALPTEQSPLTEPGVILGTLAYMSPEQVRGESVDARSDIFAFGAILYEMLSGKHAFRRDSAAETMSAILKEEPPELSESGLGIPVALDQVVRHCLEKDPHNRFQSMSDIAFNLTSASSPVVSAGTPTEVPSRRVRKTLVAGAILSALAIAAAVVLLRRPGPGGARDVDVKRVAVLPFENLGAAEDDYFADGMADEVRGKLTTLHGIEVIARASSTPYKKTGKTPQQIARELDVRYLLTATVRWQKGSGPSRVHVTPELVEVRESGAPASKWEQPFDASLTDVFQVQSDIATRVAKALDVALSSGEARRLEATPTQNLDAYDAYLKGGELLHDTGLGSPTLQKALEYFERAVALDPGFTDAWDRLSGASARLYNNLRKPELAQRALEAARKTVELAPDRPEGYVALGAYEVFVNHDSRAALDQLAKARRLAPTNLDTLIVTAGAETGLGHWDAAVASLRQAERLDPRSLHTQRRLGEILWLMRRFAESREALDRALQVAPGNLSLISTKLQTFLGEGNVSGARAVMAGAPKTTDRTALLAELGFCWWIFDAEDQGRFLRLTPDAFGSRTEWGLALAQPHASHGDSENARKYADEARRSSEEQLRESPDDPIVLSNLGLALAYLGRKEEAIRAGSQAVALDPVAKDAIDGPYYQDRLMQIYILVGEPEKALDELEPLLKIPYYYTPAWLRIDPNFNPLHANPRFQKLVAQKE